MKEKTVAFKQGYRYGLEFKLHRRPIPRLYDPATGDGRDFEAGVDKAQRIYNIGRA